MLLSCVCVYVCAMHRVGCKVIVYHYTVNELRKYRHTYILYLDQHYSNLYVKTHVYIYLPYCMMYAAKSPYSALKGSLT